MQVRSRCDSHSIETALPLLTNEFAVSKLGLGELGSCQSYLVHEVLDGCLNPKSHRRLANECLAYYMASFLGEI